MALRSKAVFKVYVGGLYLPDKESDWKRVLGEDEPRRMVMQWLRNVDKGAICDAWKEGLEANTPGAAAEVKKNFDSLCGLMQDAKAGDRLVFTYLPGTGVEVAINDQVKGTLGGKPFADALFACWIGAHPGPGESFRDALMGGK
jgi:chalcone isomerase-like protein